EGVGLRKDGSTFPAEVHGIEVSSHGKLVRVAAIRDITERKQAEQALRESEERFARLSEAAFEGVAITVQGVVQDANEQMARLFGYRLEELIGLRATDVAAPESRALV